MDAPWSFGPTSVAAFILFIGILIFVHELGHFLAAKLFDVKVLRFSLGFGPPLLSFTRGETTYQVAVVPLGGYVRMAGDQPGEELDPADRERAFSTAPIYQRALIALAGPFFNLAFPVLCFFAYNLLGPQVLQPVVGFVDPGRPAARAGLQPGDQVVSVDGTRTYSFDRLRDLVSARPGQPVTLEVDRGGERVQVELVPEATVDENFFGKKVERGIIGIAPMRQGTRVAVRDPGRAPDSVRNGDQVLRVGNRPVEVKSELEAALRDRAGQTVTWVVARGEPATAGDLLFAWPKAVTQFSVDVPEDFAGLADLGLGPAAEFVRSVVPGGAADRAGLEAGDQLVSVGGEPVRTFWSFLSRVEEHGGEPVEVVVRRDGALRELVLKPDRVECVHPVTKKTKTAIDTGLGSGPLAEVPSCEALKTRQTLLSHWPSTVPPETGRARLSLGESFTASIRQTGTVISLVFNGILGLFSNEISVENVGGPLRMFKLAAQAAEIGVFAYLQMLASVSVNLGLFNLLPIPIFDGGHLMFCLIEAVKRKPLSARTREWASLAGLAVILALVVLALRNDIMALGVF
jgi:regulator of sigma E protease